MACGAFAAKIIAESKIPANTRERAIRAGAESMQCLTGADVQAGRDVNGGN